MLLQGVGMPFFFVGLTALALSNISTANTASAAGIMTFMRTASGAIATATAATLWTSFARVSRADMAPAINGGDAVLGQMQQGGMTADQARAALERMVEVEASTIATLDIYLIVAGLFLAAAAIVWFIPKPSGPISAGGGH
jgi:DHA2 family multidrug resistance protein